MVGVYRSFTKNTLHRRANATIMVEKTDVPEIGGARNIKILLSTVSIHENYIKHIELVICTTLEPSLKAPGYSMDTFKDTECDKKTYADSTGSKCTIQLRTKERDT